MAELQIPEKAAVALALGNTRHAIALTVAAVLEELLVESLADETAADVRVRLQRLQDELDGGRI